MKSNQKLSILVWLFKAKATKDGRAPIYARITIDGLSEEIAIGRKALPQYWDTESKLVTEGGIESKVTNQKIVQTKTDLDRLFMVLQTQYKRVTPTMLKNAYNGLSPLQSKKSGGQNSGVKMMLVESLDQFIAAFEMKVQKGLRSKETVKQWKTTRAKLVSFLGFEYKVKDVPLAAIEHTFAEAFYDYLTLHISQPLSEITAKKHVKKIRQIIKIGVSRKVISSNPLEAFNCSGGDKDVMPLELTEVEAIYHKALSIKRIAQVRDAYIFQCFTGLAYQDIYNLSPEHIVQVGKKGERWLIQQRGKTEVTAMIPLLPIVEEIIERYKDDPYCKLNNRLVPVNSNYRYNVYLKELAEICGIKRELNTHLARHTFADLMLNSGIPLEDVSKMLGHKTIRTTQRYARVRKERIARGMTKVRSLLFNKDGKLKKVS
jgi:site-specific recombinase XerD